MKAIVPSKRRPALCLEGLPDKDCWSMNESYVIAFHCHQGHRQRAHRRLSGLIPKRKRLEIKAVDQRKDCNTETSPSL